MVSYEYDTWGKMLAIKDGAGNDVSGNPNHIANLNPFRYRGYYYDSETGLYYLNSRYYDPDTGRFLNADAVLVADGVQGYNMFAYCSNNPVNMFDPSGCVGKPVLVGYDMYGCPVTEETMPDDYIMWPTDSITVGCRFDCKCGKPHGKDKKHEGIDIQPIEQQVEGDNVYAPFSGKIKKMYNDNLGNYVVIDSVINGIAYRIYLGHLSEIVWDSKINGDRVTRGMLVGKMGTTGISSGVHLHYEVYDFSVGKRIDSYVF